ncbi:MAG: glycosyltransferase [Synergistes sp.]|nr:glycosyltransferase [Synergistes sp.]
MSSKSNEIRVLQILCALNGGGAERIIYDYYMRLHKEKITFDFIKTDPITGILEESLKETGSEIFLLPYYKNNFSARLAEVRSILRKKRYDVVHSNDGYRAFIDLSTAKREGVPVRIAHSHYGYIPGNPAQRLIRKCSALSTKLCATHLLACGKESAIMTWGKKAYDSGKVYALKNAIDLPKFAFSEKKRAEKRAELNIGGRFAVGNVARFSYEKNHEFLLKIFYEIKKQRDNAILLLIGSGEPGTDIEKQISALGLESSVLFLGVQNDVPDLLNAMDVFVLPSRGEGLGIAYVEAQANGMPVFGTAGRVPIEAKVTDTMNYLSLDVPPSKWAEAICAAQKERNPLAQKQIDENACDINKEYIKLAELYRTAVNNARRG